MKEFRYTMTINVFIKAEDAGEAETKYQEMEIRFKDEVSGETFQSDIIDVDSEEVID
jgi:hypothetical protein